MENSRRLVEKRIHGRFDPSGRFVNLDGSPVDFETSNIGSQNSPNSTPHDEREATENEPLLGDSNYQQSAGEYDDDLKQLKDAVDNGDLESAKDALGKISDKLGKEGKKEAKDAIDKAKQILDDLNKGKMPSTKDVKDLADKVRKASGNQPGDPGNEPGDPGNKGDKPGDQGKKGDQKGKDEKPPKGDGDPGDPGDEPGDPGDGESEEEESEKGGGPGNPSNDNSKNGKQGKQSGQQGKQGQQGQQGNQGQQGQGDDDNPIEEPDPDVIYVDLNTNFRYKWNGKEFERL